ncbi:MAG: MFS transporter [Actinobacteria bacterium]|nr:MFS transporter [Actinomycetota bacterium]
MTSTETRTDPLRQRRGWYTYGWGSHVFPTIVVTVFMGRYLTSLAENAVGKSGRVSVFGIPVAPGSLFAYLVSFATVLLVVAMPVVGAIADRTGAKREILLGFGWLGAAACAAMFAVRGSNWQLGAALFVVAYLGYSCATVVNYALLVDVAGTAERDRVSSAGWALAYVGGGLVLAADFALSLFLSDKALLARISLATAGIWWALFNVRSWRLLAGLPRNPAASGGEPVLIAGFRQLRRTLAEVRRFPLTVAFLAAFLIYNDGIQTVTTVAAQYGDKELHLDDTVLLSAILLVQFVAFAGALGLGRLAERFGAKRVVLGSLVVWLLLVLAAYFVRAGAAWQFYLLAVGIAVVLGGSQALSRSMFSRLIPAGSEAEYFGFYEISDSGTSWLGPLLFGLAYQLTGSYRSALASLVVFFVVGFALLARVPLRAAIVAAGNAAPERV